ncbi:MAG: tRNA pseudouridine(55) synthase TruB [Bacteroidales bacterium]|nr:tRNA pseudouridine(55) synthase TruB [Bacteroidales bacterium]
MLQGNIDDYPGGIVLPIDKPYRWTSADVVRKVKFIAQKHFHKRNIKVGHAGTLDPLATGILLVCLGKATKQAEALQAEQKEYIASIELGATTPCFDLEKEIDKRYPYEHITREMVEEMIPRFIGEQDQIPPIFSAKLIDGTRAYEMARAGEEVQMKPARITIYELEIVEFELPRLVLRVKCSKGTYIRSLARDVGMALGSGGHLTGLQRSRSGGFSIDQALKMEDMELIMKK